MGDFLAEIFKSDSSSVLKITQDNSELFEMVRKDSLDTIMEDSESALAVKNFAKDLSSELPSGTLKSQLTSLVSNINEKGMLLYDKDIDLALHKSNLIDTMRGMEMGVCVNILGVSSVETAAEAAKIINKITSDIDVEEFKKLSDSNASIGGENIINNLHDIKGSGKLTTSDFKAMNNVNSLKNNIAGKMLSDDGNSFGKKLLESFGDSPEKGMNQLGELSEKDMKLIDELADSTDGLFKDGKLNEEALDKLKNLRKAVEGPPPRNFGKALERYKKLNWDEGDFDKDTDKWKQRQKRIRNTAKTIGFGISAVGSGFLGNFLSNIKQPVPGCPKFLREGAHAIPTCASPAIPTTNDLGNICSEYGSKYQERPNSVSYIGGINGTIDYNNLNNLGNLESYPKHYKILGSPYNKYWEISDGDVMPNTYGIPTTVKGRWPHYIDPDDPQSDKNIDLSWLGKGCGDCMEAQTISKSIPILERGYAQATCEGNRVLNNVLGGAEKLLSNFCNLLSEGITQFKIWGMWFGSIAFLILIYKGIHFINSKFANYIYIPLFIYISLSSFILIGRISYLMFHSVTIEESEKDKYTCDIKFPDIDLKGKIDDTTKQILIIITGIYICISVICIISFVFSHNSKHSQVNKVLSDHPEAKVFAGRIQGGGKGGGKGDGKGGGKGGGKGDGKGGGKGGSLSNKVTKKLNRYNKWLIIILIIFAMIITHYYKKQRGVMKDKQYLRNIKKLKEEKENDKPPQKLNEISNPYQPTGVFGGKYL